MNLRRSILSCLVFLAGCGAPSAPDGGTATGGGAASAGGAATGGGAASAGGAATGGGAASAGGSATGGGAASAGGAATGGGAASAGGAATGGGAASAGGAATGGGAASAGGAATGGGSAGGTVLTADGGIPMTGSLLINQTSSPQGAWNSTVLASFMSVLVTESVVSARCASTILGDCRFSDCTVQVPVDAGLVATAPTQFSAGPLTFTGLIDGGFTLPPDVNSLYLSSGTQRLWLDGAQVAITAPGAAVPPFTVAFEGPSSLTLQLPLCGPQSCPAISRATDLTVRWTGQTGTASVGLNIGGKLLACQAPASAGQLVIPAAALSRLPTGNADFQLSASSSPPPQLVGGFLLQSTITSAKSALSVTLQ
ncbi:MAG: hypothetical protein Q8S33_20135 [Myxococcales bacterium]|nr:hypothetical protein [Myxococcales bacterium]